MAQSFTTRFDFHYDVFLSFRGEDTRYNFTRNLYNALHTRGIVTFFDDRELRGGDELSHSLFEAIENSRMFVIVFSENYASSTWCLKELVKILQCAKQNNRCIWPVFYKVDPSDIRQQKNNYDGAMIKHEQRFGEDSELVRNWRSALTEVASLKGDHFEKTGHVYECDFIEKIVMEISSRLLPKGLDVGQDVVGLESRMEEVISLLDISSQSTVCMLGVYGIGGIGKTTLAKVVYNRIGQQFEFVCFLSDVRETSNESKGLVRLQKTLLSKMLNLEDIEPSSVDEGAFQIKIRLCNKRVLLVLDDVDCKKQLKKLAGECKWFGPGSRIIITTRDIHLLNAHGVEKKYEMKELDDHEASKLFCLKAFRKSHPPKGFVDLSNEVVKYASGLPLALEVTGSNLCDKDLDECICALNEYKRIPNKDIQRILRISYDGLGENQREIFLDIACFFKGYNLQEIINAWEACNFGPKYNVGVLVNKSLITVDSLGYIGMHDLIQLMGREVVRKEAPKEPRLRSRLWSEEDIIEVLEENLGTSKIEGIMLKSSQQEIRWEGTAFKSMRNLRILIIRNACFSVGPKYLPNNLQILEWNQCPLTSLPLNFDPKNLVVLKMPDSPFKLEISSKNFRCLSVMNFSNCQSIIEVPDMSGALALKSLNFSKCKNLVKVHDSIGFLPKVRILNLEHCKNLRSLPSALQMPSLEELHIQFCNSLEHFPDILGNMDCLYEIYAWDTAIKKLPNSIGNLTSLMHLDVSGCTNLQEIYEIPSNLCGISAEGCTSLNSHSLNVLQSQAKNDILNLHIIMPGAQIPDWFEHCSKGNVLSFWVRQKLRFATLAFIYRCEDGCENRGLDYNWYIFINGIEMESPGLRAERVYKGCHLHLQYQMMMDHRFERYLVLEWNHVEIKLVTESVDVIIDECGIYVYEEDVRFDCPSITRPIETVLRKTYSVQKGKQILPQNQHNVVDFPWKSLWKLHLPPKVIIFLWELVNCVLLNPTEAEVPHICSLCGVVNETLQHIFIQCTFARALWFGSQLSIRSDSLELPDVVHLINLCLQVGHTNAEVHKELTRPMALMLYTIWDFRNKAIFKGETPSSEGAFNVWLRFCQKYLVACPAMKQTNSNFARNRAPTCSNSDYIDVRRLPRGFYEIYLSVHRVKKFTSKITYCQAFIISRLSRMFEGIFLMSGRASKFQVLFQGLRSLLREEFYKPDFVRDVCIYMPSSSCIEMLNDPSMAPPHLQTIVKDVNCLLMSTSYIQKEYESYTRYIPSSSVRVESGSKGIRFGYGSFPHSSSVRINLGSLGRIGKCRKWRFYAFCKK